MNKAELQDAMSKALAWRPKHDYTYAVVFGNGNTLQSLHREFKSMSQALAFAKYCEEIGLKTKLEKQTP